MAEDIATPPTWPEDAKSAEAKPRVYVNTYATKEGAEARPDSHVRLYMTRKPLVFDLSSVL
jgi:hypothetical protein